MKSGRPVKDLCDVLGAPDGEWDLEIEDQMIFVDEINEQRTTNNEDKYVKIVLGRLLDLQNSICDDSW